MEWFVLPLSSAGSILTFDSESISCPPPRSPAVFFELVQASSDLLIRFLRSPLIAARRFLLSFYKAHTLQTLKVNLVRLTAPEIAHFPIAGPLSLVFAFWEAPQNLCIFFSFASNGEFPEASDEVASAAAASDTTRLSQEVSYFYLSVRFVPALRQAKKKQEKQLIERGSPEMCLYTFIFLLSPVPWRRRGRILLCCLISSSCGANAFASEDHRDRRLVWFGPTFPFRPPLDRMSSSPPTSLLLFFFFFFLVDLERSKASHENESASHCPLGHRLAADPRRLLGFRHGDLCLAPMGLELCWYDHVEFVRHLLARAGIPLLPVSGDGFSGFMSTPRCFPFYVLGANRIGLWFDDYFKWITLRNRCRIGAFRTRSTTSG